MTKYRAIRSSETFHTNSLSVKAGSPNSWSVLEDQLKKNGFHCDTLIMIFFLDGDGGVVMMMAFL